MHQEKEKKPLNIVNKGDQYKKTKSSSKNNCYHKSITVTINR